MAGANILLNGLLSRHSAAHLLSGFYISFLLYIEDDKESDSDDDNIKIPKLSSSSTLLSRDILNKPWLTI